MPKLKLFWPDSSWPRRASSETTSFLAVGAHLAAFIGGWGGLGVLRSLRHTAAVVIAAHTNVHPIFASPPARPAKQGAGIISIHRAEINAFSFCCVLYKPGHKPITLP